MPPTLISSALLVYLTFGKMETQLAQKGVTIEIDTDARQWLAVHGYDVAMGARPMARVIKEYIKKPLAEELLFGKLEGGGFVHVTVQDDKLAFEFESKAKEPALVE